jgi:TPP-dependent pyruvate/acetoin dehydrogenase alpha subunit
MQFDSAKLRQMYTTMERIRGFEKELMARGARYEQVFVMTRGMEAVATGVCAMMGEKDYLLSTHRTQAHCIAKGVRLDRMMAEFFFKATGYCKGHGGRQHMADLSLGIVGGTGVVGSNIPIACGLGLSCKLQHQDRVAVCIFGDGASTTGAFHEGLGLAALWDLPIVYVIENNQYAGYIPITDQTKLKKLSDRAKGYGIPGVTVDGTDVIAVAEATAKAIKRAKAGKGPTLIEAVTLVMGGGTISNEGREWRSKEELAEWMKRDPVLQFRSKLIKDKVLTEAEADEIKAQAEKEAEAASKFEAQSPEPNAKDALSDIYYEGK